MIPVYIRPSHVKLLGILCLVTGAVTLLGFALIGIGGSDVATLGAGFVGGVVQILFGKMLLRRGHHPSDQDGNPMQ